MAMIRNDSMAFRAAVDEVARQLVSTDHREDVSFIKTPLQYPSGANVVIRVCDAYPNYLVTDFGAGYDEAEMMGAGAIFSRNARAVADRAGIGFDSHAFFVAEATQSQLAGVIVVVANASQEAASIAALKLAERRYIDDTETLYQRLVSVLPQRKVAKDAEVIGHSNTPWHVATLVTGPAHRTIFEPVANHHASIFAATTKFHDIADTEDAPSRVAVVRSKSDLKTYLGVLSSAANVIEKRAPDETLVRLAA